MDVAASVMSGMVNGRISRPSCHSLRVCAETNHTSGGGGDGGGGDGRPTLHICSQKSERKPACGDGSLCIAHVLGLLHPGVACRSRGCVRCSLSLAPRTGVGGAGSARTLPLSWGWGGVPARHDHNACRQRVRWGRLSAQHPKREGLQGCRAVKQHSVGGPPTQLRNSTL